MDDDWDVSELGTYELINNNTDNAEGPSLGIVLGFFGFGTAIGFTFLLGVFSWKIAKPYPKKHS